MSYATVCDYEMYYEDQGAGDALVLLHGGLDTSAGWASFIPLYARHYRVLATDRWGYGRSSARPGFEPGFLRQDALDLAAFLDGLGLRRAHVLGHSDGGSIGLLLALERPDLVRSLVAVAAHTHAEAKTLAGLRRAQEWVLSSIARRSHLARQLGPNGTALIEAWYAHWLDPAQRPLDIRGEIGRITAPTLVIQGLDDEFATPAHAEGIARAIAGAELWLIPACRHAPQLEHPEAFNERVLDFLARH